jgi:serine/threonine-protein kinase RsbW
VTEPLRIERPATPENLAHFLAFIDGACARFGVDGDTRYALRLAVEEVCINLTAHGYAGLAPGPIAISAQAETDCVTITIRDFARPFDPSSAPPPDLTSAAESRLPGGLGWYLLKQFIDEVHYVANAREGNLLTLVQKTRPRTTSGEHHGN